MSPNAFAASVLGLLFFGNVAFATDEELQYYYDVIKNNRESVRNARVEMRVAYQPSELLLSQPLPNGKYLQGELFITTEYAIDGDMLSKLTGELIDKSTADHYLIKNGSMHKYFSGIETAYIQPQQLAKPSHPVDPLAVATRSPVIALEDFFIRKGSHIAQSKKLSEFETELWINVLVGKNDDVIGTYKVVFDSRYRDMPTSCEYTVSDITTCRYEWTYDEPSQRQRAIFPTSWRCEYYGPEQVLWSTTTCTITKAKLLSDWARETLELPLPAGTAVADAVEKKAFHIPSDEDSGSRLWLWCVIAVIGTVVGFSIFRRRSNMT